MTKLVTSRKAFACQECKAPVNKGDSYARKTRTIGNPRHQTVENRAGIPTIIEHGFSYTAKLCEKCAGSFSQSFAS